MALFNGGGVGSLMDGIGFLWRGIVGGMVWSLEMTDGARGVANFGAMLRFACSSGGGGCLHGGDEGWC